MSDVTRITLRIPKKIQRKIEIEIEAREVPISINNFILTCIDLYIKKYGQIKKENI